MQLSAGCVFIFRVFRLEKQYFSQSKVSMMIRSRLTSITDFDHDRSTNLSLWRFFDDASSKSLSGLALRTLTRKSQDWSTTKYCYPQICMYTHPVCNQLNLNLEIQSLCLSSSVPIIRVLFCLYKTRESSLIKHIFLNTLRVLHYIKTTYWTRYRYHDASSVFIKHEKMTQ